MDCFKEGLDLFITEDGRAQNRIPSDLTQIATQQGTVLNEDMLNGMVFEIRNAIEGLGETPDRNKENQLITGLKNFFKTELDSFMTVVKNFFKTELDSAKKENTIQFEKNIIYKNIGQVKSWICAKDKIPTSEAVLDGSILNPADYEDNLQALLKVFPSWSSDGQVQLPNYNNYFQRYQISDSRIPGSKQEHSMQKLTVNTSSFSASAYVTIPGKAELIMTPEEYIYEPASNFGKLYERDSYTLRHQSDTSQRITVNATGTMSLAGATTDNANENRPQNFAVLMAVVVGVRKIVEN